LSTNEAISAYTILAVTKVGDFITLGAEPMRMNNGELFDKLGYFYFRVVQFVVRGLVMRLEAKVSF